MKRCQTNNNQQIDLEYLLAMNILDKKSHNDSSVNFSHILEGMICASVFF